MYAVPKDLTPLLNLGNHRHSQDALSQMFGRTEVVAWEKNTLLHSFPSTAKKNQTHSESSYQPCCCHPGSSADEFGTVLELQMLRTSEALIPTISLSEHRLFIGRASPLLKQCSICPELQPKGSITGDFRADAAQQSAKLGWKSEVEGWGEVV